MNIKKKIEQYLQAAPKPPAPDGLLNRLQEDAAVTNVKPYASFARRFFVPTGRSISLRRVAVAAAIAFVILLPLSYGAAKVIRYFTIGEIRIVVKNSDNIKNEKEAQKALEEFGKLYREGEAKEINPGVWQVTLPSGEKFSFAGNNPEWVGLPEAEQRGLLKKQFDEINELRKAGRCEKIYKPEHNYEVDGVKYRYFEARYTLSNGKVVTIGSSEPVKDDEDKD